MGYCKKDVTPLLMHWSYVFPVLTHQNIFLHRLKMQMHFNISWKQITMWVKAEYIIETYQHS